MLSYMHNVKLFLSLYHYHEFNKSRPIQFFLWKKYSEVTVETALHKSCVISILLQSANVQLNISKNELLYIKKAA